LHPGTKELPTPRERPPLTETRCQEVEKLRDAFTREWQFYRHAPDAEREAAALRARELPVVALNIRRTSSTSCIRTPPYGPSRRPVRT